MNQADNVTRKEIRWAGKDERIHRRKRRRPTARESECEGEWDGDIF